MHIISSIKKSIVILVTTYICKIGEINIKQEEESSHVHYKCKIHEIIVKKIWLNNY